MFRELTRKNKALSAEECAELLETQLRGVLSVQGDDGYPYGMPMNFWYDKENGHIYFHSGKHGHKIDALNGCDKVSFCVYDGGYRREGEWNLNIKSVIVFGRIRFVEDMDEIIRICRELSYRFTDDKKYIEDEILCHGAKTLCLELIPEHVTGKLVNEA